MYYFYCCAYARHKGGFSGRAYQAGSLKGGAVRRALKRASAKRLLWTPGSGNLCFVQLQAVVVVEQK